LLFIEAWYERAAALRQVFSQPDARLFTRPVGCARLTQGTDECFDVSIGPLQPFDGIGERPACGRIPVQKFLSFLACHLLASQPDRSIDMPVGKHHRHDKREHDHHQEQDEVLPPLDVFDGSLCSVRTLLFFPEPLSGRRRVFHLLTSLFASARV
jgi:hypothetical protein